MRILLVVLLGALIVGCGSGADVVKPTPLTPIQTSLVDFSSEWERGVSYSVPDHFAAIKPAVVDHMIYVADPDGQITAISSDKDKIMWRRHVKAHITGGLKVGAGMLLAGTTSGEVLALRSSDGAVLWRRQVSSEVLSSPAISGGIVVVRALDDTVFGLDANSGEQRWIYKRNTPPLSLHGASSPVISGEKVIIGLADGALVALGLYDGQLIWETQIAEPKGRSELEHIVDIDADPVVMDGTVYAVTYQGHAAAVDIQTGRQLWSRDFSAYLNLKVAGEDLFVVDDKDNIWALDRDTGATLWKQDKLAYRRISAPAIVDGYLIVGDFEGYVHWLDITSGFIVGRYRVGDEGVTVSPFSDGSHIDVLTDGGKLVALKVSKK